MSKNLETLEKIVSPYELVGALQLSTRITEDEHYQVQVPGEGWLWLLEGGFLSLRSGSSFRAGSIVDLTALTILKERDIRGPQLYTAAIDKLSALFPDRLSNFLTPGVTIDLAEEVRQRRMLFEIISCDGMNSPGDRTAIQQGFLSRFLDTGVNVYDTPYYVSILNHKQMSDVNGILLDMEINPIPPSNGVLYPYYSNHHTVSYLKYSEDASGAINGARSITPAKYATFGLLDVSPTQQMFLIPGAMEALSFNGQHKSFAPGVTGCDITYLPQHSHTSGWLPEQLQYIYKADGRCVFDLAVPAALVKENTEVFVLPAGEPITVSSRVRQPFDAFVLDLVISKIKSVGRVGKDTKAIIRNVNVTGDSRQNLIKALKQEGMAFALRDMEQLMPEGVVVAQGRKIIMSTLQGYTAIETGNEGGQTTVSNFTLKFKSNIVFPEVDAMYHTGHILMTDREIPFMLHSSDLESIKKLDAALKQADILYPRANSGQTSIPTFIDHSAARSLLPNFRTQVADLKVESGVSTLGWDGMREVFTGRGFTITQNNCNYAQHTPHPTTPTFKFFDFGERTEEEMYENLPEPICDLFSQAVAMVARYRSGRKVSPVFIRNTPENEKLLLSVFKGLGQIKPIQLNNNTRGKLDITGVAGYPVMAIGLDRSRRSNCEASAFILSDAGYSFGRFDPKFYSTLGKILHTILVKVVSNLLKEETPVKFSSSVLYESELVREGAALIRRTFDLVAWPQTELPYETLESILRSISVDDVSTYFAHDLAKQKVYFYHKDIAKKGQIRDLFLELSTLVEGLVEREGYFEMDPQGVTELLNNFYQDNVRIAPINVGDLAAKLEALG